MPASFDSQAKRTIRTNWAKPILSFLAKKLKKKLFYLGLPSEEALDIKEWLEYLNVIYAFQCRDYPKPSDESQSREKVLSLDAFLRELERKKQIETFEVFDGYLEEVVLRGFDNSPTYKELFQDDIVTIYNLDYCNSITSPIKYVDKYGNEKEAYKFDAIKRLMRMQSDLSIAPKNFVLFLTVHCSYDDGQTQNFRSL